MSRKTFKRAEGRTPWAKDERGTVRISVCLKSKRVGGNARGNITRYLSIQDAKVSEVYEALEKALFGENAVSPPTPERPPREPVPPYERIAFEFADRVRALNEEVEPYAKLQEAYDWYIGNNSPWTVADIIHSLRDARAELARLRAVSAAERRVIEAARAWMNNCGINENEEHAPGQCSQCDLMRAVAALDAASPEPK